MDLKGSGFQVRISGLECRFGTGNICLVSNVVKTQAECTVWGVEYCSNSGNNLYEAPAPYHVIAIELSFGVLALPKPFYHEAPIHPKP